MKNPFQRNNSKSNSIKYKVLTGIGYAIFEHVNNDYDKAYEIIDQIGITNIIIKRKIGRKYNIYIEANRPGIFIGKKGELIDKIKTSLKEDLKASEVNIYVFESNLNGLYCFDCRSVI